jgi:hypothetical protein
MAYLRFEHSECEVRSDPRAPGKVQVELALTVPARAKLREALGELIAREGSELRSDLSEGWTIFWKIRDGESRFLLAHPEHDQWVATLALSASHLGLIRDGLDRGYVGPLADLERVAGMSNLDVRVAIR